MARVSCELRLSLDCMRVLPVCLDCMRVLPVCLARMGERNRGDGGQRQPKGQSKNCGRLQMMHEVDRGEAVQSFSSLLNTDRKSK
jgi:hypothetical protein